MEEIRNISKKYREAIKHISLNDAINIMGMKFVLVENAKKIKIIGEVKKDG